jgi:short-subunit dehydrogenase
MKVLLFGSTGGIGHYVMQILNQAGYEIIAPYIDFTQPDTEQQITNLLEENQPNIIINCTGVLGDIGCSFDDVFHINVKSNWEIIKQCINTNLVQPRTLILIGSSSYNKGHRDYMLYAASKASVYSLYLSTVDHIDNNDTQLIIGLVNPPRTATNMISHLPKTGYELLPYDVANYIVNFAVDIKKSSILNIINK